MSQKVLLFMILAGLLYMIFKNYLKVYPQLANTGGWFSEPGGQGGGGGSSGAG